MHGVIAIRAYQQSARHRSFSAQEADVFLRVNAVLRGAVDGEDLLVSSALADNERLWQTVLDLMRDPQNQMPSPLRASVISVGMAVQREIRKPSPDLRFMIGINEQIAAGLSGT